MKENYSHTMKEYIKNKLVELYTNCRVDQFGQVSRWNFGLKGLFGERTEEVLEYIKHDPVIKISLYGNSYGTYKAVMDILDAEIKSACVDALRSNLNYQRNMRRW
jgi:RNA-binding protein YhbY